MREINLAILRIPGGGVSAAATAAPVPALPMLAAFDEGGFVGTDDRAFPALLHPGAFVMQRTAVDRLGVPTLERLNHLKMKLPKFETGGPVSPGHDYITAERKLEMFLPSRVQIASGSATKASGGGVVINQKIEIDARGAEAGVEKRIRREVQFAHADAVQRAVAVTRELALRTP